MDRNNWMSQGQPPLSGDWRSQLRPDSRQRIVQRMIDTLKRRYVFSADQEAGVRNLMLGFEERTYCEAVSQHDYMQKLSLKMRPFEAKPQSSLTSSAVFDPSANSGPPPHSGSPQPTVLGGQLSTSDWLERTYQKINVMKERHLKDLTEMRGVISSNLPPTDDEHKHEALIRYMWMVEQSMAFLQCEKRNITPSAADKVSFYDTVVRDMPTSSLNKVIMLYGEDPNHCPLWLPLPLLILIIVLTSSI